MDTPSCCARFYADLKGGWRALHGRRRGLIGPIAEKGLADPKAAWQAWTMVTSAHTGDG